MQPNIDFTAYFTLEYPGNLGKSISLLIKHRVLHHGPCAYNFRSVIFPSCFWWTWSLFQEHWIETPHSHWRTCKICTQTVTWAQNGTKNPWSWRRLHFFYYILFWKHKNPCFDILILKCSWLDLILSDSCWIKASAKWLQIIVNLLYRKSIRGEPSLGK